MKRNVKALLILISLVAVLILVGAVLMSESEPRNACAIDETSPECISLFNSLCLNTDAPYCVRASLSSSSEGHCNTSEIFPPWECSSGVECQKGVGYSTENLALHDNWSGCGYHASQKWLEGN